MPHTRCTHAHTPPLHAAHTPAPRGLPATRTCHTLYLLQYAAHSNATATTGLLPYRRPTGGGAAALYTTTCAPAAPVSRTPAKTTAYHRRHSNRISPPSPPPAATYRTTHLPVATALPLDDLLVSLSHAACGRIPPHYLPAHHRATVVVHTCAI